VPGAAAPMLILQRLYYDRPYEPYSRIRTSQASPCRTCATTKVTVADTIVALSGKYTRGSKA